MLFVFKQHTQLIFPQISQNYLCHIFQFIVSLIIKTYNQFCFKSFCLSSEMKKFFLFLIGFLLIFCQCREKKTANK
jgi:hypothetical protein